MCKIDAALAGLSLDEKSTPEERFKQALDESTVSDTFSALLTKNFATNWRESLGEVTSIEKALAATKPFESDLEKLVAFLKSDAMSFKFDLAVACFLQDNSISERHPIFEFAIDAVRAFCSNSPFSLYESGLGKDLGLGNMLFVSIVYGNDYFTENFFNTPTLESLSPEKRADTLWRFFCAIVCRSEHTHRIQPTELRLDANDLSAILNTRFREGPPTQQTYRFLKGMEFLKAWVEYDAKLGLIHTVHNPLFDQVTIMLYGLQSIAVDFKGDEREAQFHSWLKEQRKVFELLCYTNVDLSNASDDIQNQWAEGLEAHYSSHSSDWRELAHLPQSECNERHLVNQQIYLNELMTKLSPLNHEVWMQYTIDRDINDALENSSYKATRRLEKQCKWCFGATYKPWQSLFLKSLQALRIEQQLNVLSLVAPFPDFPRNVDTDEVVAFWREHKQWWNNLFFNLVSISNFPKYLLPTWTIAARDSRSAAELLPYIDNSIGFLRGELSKEIATEKQTKVYQAQLTTLLGWMDEVNQQKSLRHRLMLMRSSQVSLSDEGLNYRNGQPDSLWYKPLKELCRDLFNFERRTSPEQHLVTALETFYIEFSKQIAEFCLSRLRLRKGEKANDGQYDSTQTVEQSSAWRQGYLKVLSEIGYDLNGQVHKTVNFVKQSDPDPDVRAIAKEAYKTVRRQSSPTQTLEDIKRGIIAAEWWLLLCQRQELKLPIDHEAAVQTRRKLLRNP
ncbi:hypothetical protein [Rheinheimera oceanensis]|uniref:hypothetical protein n=1 Tax=Rheinheimera oceanensis TaxID=2817449 RepID=UPI001BFDD2AB|nr:hypothetical protein [Rheinheimera oceanensis]